MKYLTLRRVAVAIGLYAGLVLVAGVAFYCLRQGIPERSSRQYLYALGGPALSLFTHMSYYLFMLQTALLLPWLLLGALRAQVRILSAVAFVLSWLSVGWYMHDLF